MLLAPLLLPVSTPAVLGMALTALAMAFTPGPNMMYLTSRSIGQGRTAGLVSLIGTGLGFLTYLLMANLGLAVVFVAVPWLFIALKLAGVIYLAWMAWQALRPGGAGVFEVRETHQHSNGVLFRMGLLTNLLNPKTAIMYLTVIPQFIVPSRGHHLEQGLVLGLVQITISLTVNALIVIAAGSIAVFMAQRPAWTRWQRRVTGTMLGTLAVVLAREVPARARI